MFLRAMVIAGLSCLIPASQAQNVDPMEKPNLSGTWELRSGGAGPAKATWVIEQDDKGIKIHDLADHKTEFTCNTTGKECKAQIGGETAKVTLWYHGPTLVEMAVIGADGQKVTKTRRTLSPDGKSMAVETMYIVPPGKEVEKVVLERVGDAKPVTTSQTR